jgi:hypothetical protein
LPLSLSLCLLKFLHEYIMVPTVSGLG